MARGSSSTARDAARGAQTVEMIRANGGSARFVAADLSDPAAIERLAEETGEIDILVNNAGILDVGADRGPRRRHLRCHVCRQCPRTVLSRRGVCAEDGRARQWEHHQHR